MLRGLHLQAGNGVVALMCFVIGVAAWVLFTGEAKRPELSAASQTALRNPTGYPQLVSVAPLPTMDGEMCQWMPASASMTLMGALLQGQQDQRATAATRAAASNEGGAPPIEPVRTIRDPYASFSAVAVDPVRNEVIMTDQSLLSILVYDRLANTPATANMTEPKRILSGSNTNIEFQCGVYVDPATGDIYALNGDTEENMVIFAHGRSGNVAPDRKLHTPHGTFGIAVDEEAQELYMTLQHDQTVVVFDLDGRSEGRADLLWNRAG